MHTSEGIISDFTRLVSNSDRLIYIYTLTGIIVATVIITLFRSFFFFSASIFRKLSRYYLMETCKNSLTVAEYGHYSRQFEMSCLAAVTDFTANDIYYLWFNLNVILIL